MHVVSEKNTIFEKLPSRREVEEKLRLEFQPKIGKEITKTHFFEEGELVASSNCQAGYILFEDNKKFFFKMPQNSNTGNVYREVNAVSWFTHFYECNQVPIYFSNDFSVIVYPWIDGETKLNLLHKFDDTVCEGPIIKTELSQAAEIVTAYKKSIPKIQQETTIGQPVHDLHYNRLIGERYKKYYENANVLFPDGSSVIFEQLLEYPVVVNDIEYPSLGNLFKRARKYTNPSFLNSVPKVFGLGDCHGGNTIVHPGDSDRYTNIDFEFSGIHPAELDIAKALSRCIWKSLCFS